MKKKIIVFHGNQPCIETKYDEVQKVDFGLNRNRQPDGEWGEFRWTRLDKKYYKEVPLTPKLRKILTEDICEYYKGKEAYEKLTSFGLLK
jgi:hypothetical protein